MWTLAPNNEQARLSNRDEDAYWLVDEPGYEARLAPFTDNPQWAAAVGPTDRALDVGYGFGSSTRAAGRRAAEGPALGVDLSHHRDRQGAVVGQRRDPSQSLPPPTRDLRRELTVVRPSALAYPAQVGDGASRVVPGGRRLSALSRTTRAVGGPSRGASS